MKKIDILKIIQEEFNAAKLLIEKGNISKKPKNKLEKNIENYIQQRSNKLLEQGILNKRDHLDFFEVSFEEMLKESYPEYFDTDIINFRKFKKVSTKLRFKYIVEKVNNTGNDDWFHYEKHWKLQYSNLKDIKEGKRNWENVDDVYFLKDSNGEEQEISLEEYQKLINKNKS